MCILSNVTRTCSTKFLSHITNRLYNGCYMKLIESPFRGNPTMSRRTKAYSLFWCIISRNNPKKVFHNCIYMNQIFFFYRLSCQWMYHIIVPPYALWKGFHFLPFALHESFVLLQRLLQGRRFAIPVPQLHS